MYSVYLSSFAEKFIHKQERLFQVRINNRLKKLSLEPYPKDAKFIDRRNEDKIFRIRIGKYRVLYNVDETEKIVAIVDIDKRSRVYQRRKL